MSIIARIPDNSRALFPIARFRSSNFLAGVYDWENAGNRNVTLIDTLARGHVYLIERTAFQANVAESDWLGSMLTAQDFPRIKVSFNTVGPSSLYADPFRCVSYSQNDEHLTYFRAQQKDASLVATMYGAVGQTPGMVGNLYLLAQMNFSIYEIIDAAWIEQFEHSHIARDMVGLR